MKASWKDVIGAVAPGLATLLGGPLAGVAVKAIATKLLGKEDASEADIEAAIQGMGPADLIKLKEIEADLAKSMTDAGIKLEEVAAKDRDSARVRQATLKDPTPNVLAVLVLGAFGTVLWLLFQGQSLGADAQVIYILLGTLTAAVTQVLNFYFGSSVGSQQKTTALAGVAQRKSD
jgi:hypothetical protein